MKTLHLVPIVAFAVLLATGCNKKSPELAKQLAELERKANEATERQQELEQQIEDQKLAAERDAIERERMQIEEARAELERQQGDDAAAEAEKLRQREEALAAREGKLELLQSNLADKQNDLQQRDEQLSERDRELAGREAVALDDENDAEEAAPVGDYGMFYDSLSSYGSWFETADYGYVWQPVIVRDVSWRPYTRGRWACTNRGWTWISDEPFGWATYHYGRWALCRGFGWVWVPGSEWAPSWVCWRSSGTNIGWAPLPPETLAYRRHHWDSSVDVTYGIGASWFCFVETRNFCEPIQYHCLPYHQNHIYVRLSNNITNIHERNRRIICGGPSYGDVARQTTRRPPFYRIEEDRQGRPGRERIEGGRIKVAAPNLDVAWNDGLKPNKIKGRMESVKVERQEELRPELADRFRQSREESRMKADQSIAELGGAEKFKQRRMEQLETNRREAVTQARRNEKLRETGKPNETGRIAERTDRKPETKGRETTTARIEQDRPKVDQTGKRDDPARIFPPKNGGKQARDETPPKQEQAGKRDDGPKIFPPRDPNKQVQDDTAGRIRKQQEVLAEQARQREETARKQQQTGNRDDGPKIFPPRDPNKQVQDDSAARLRRQQEALAEQARQSEETARKQQQPGKRDDGPKIYPPRDPNKQAQDDSAARMNKQQQDQAERAREQQQQEAQRQREQARQQQAEETRREQARQQQQAAAQQQREQARQQQMEESRREQARQQQQEENRREQARQQQMEESRREQARQQQQEESRREQARQQQQEESRREQSRQQQQQQKDEEDRKGGRNR